MTDNDRGQVVTVSCRECSCPGTPGTFHEMDEVYLLETPGLRLGLAAQLKIQSSLTNAAGVIADPDPLVLDLSEIFVQHGAVGWNLVTEDGLPQPFSPAAVLADMSLGLPVSDRASDLYMEKVTAPLVKKLASLSPIGRTSGSKSRTKASTRSRPARSSRPASAASLRSMP